MAAPPDQPEPDRVTPSEPPPYPDNAVSADQSPPNDTAAPPWARVSARIALICSIFGVLCVSIPLGIAVLVRGGRSVRVRAIAALVISAIWATVVAVSIAREPPGQRAAENAGGDDNSPSYLEVGECIGYLPDTNDPDTVITNDCGRKHFAEVVAVLSLPHKEVSPGCVGNWRGGVCQDAPYPDQAMIDSTVNRCPGELQAYSPAASQDPNVSIQTLIPTLHSWQYENFVAVICVAKFNIQRTGSIKLVKR